ncbi:MAG TPA: insulinase family protein, partial [Saprospiraceae bacterium]|nr:insulinase family protein [Saprospiraceae bacterium]
DDLKAEDLIAILHDLSQYKHKILYYGPKSSTELVKIISKIHEAPKVFKNMPKPVKYVQLSQTENQVLTTHFDMVQAEVYWIRSGDKYNKSTVPVASLFNEYFGGGMGSIVFQTIRESKALAYSTFAFFGNPSNKNYRTTFRAYVGTQSDKFKEAVDGMNELLNTLPESQKALEIAKEGLEKNLASERITEDAILFDYLNAQRLGLETDIRKNTYTQIKNMTYKDLETFHAKEISHKPYTYCVLAGEGKIDAANLNALGKVKELSLEELFGY